jgi:hypothetical protein
MALHVMGQFKEPRHDIIEIWREASNETATSAVKEEFQSMSLGEAKKKLILKVEGTGAPVTRVMYLE